MTSLAVEVVVKAPFWKVRVRLLTSLASAWLSAVPVRVTVITVSLSRLTAAVSPAGTLVTSICVPRVMGSLKVSSDRVATMLLPVTLPSLAAASLNSPDQLRRGKTSVCVTAKVKSVVPEKPADERYHVPPS